MLTTEEKSKIVFTHIIELEIDSKVSKLDDDESATDIQYIPQNYAIVEDLGTNNTDGDSTRLYRARQHERMETWGFFIGEAVD